MSMTKEKIEEIYVQYFQKELRNAVEQKDGVSKDVILVCDGKEFPAHSAVLKIGSPYFQSLLGNGEQIGDTETTRRVNVDDIDAIGLDISLHFLYWGKIKTDDAKLDEMKSVLKASFVLDIELLNSYCWQTLLSKLSDECFVELWQLSETYKKEESQDDLVCFVACNFARAAKSNDFVNLTPSQLKQLLTHPALKATTDTIVTSLLKWAKGSTDDRREDLYRFLELQDLNDVTNAVLGQTIENDYVRKSRCIFDLFRPIVTARLRKTQNQHFFTGNNLVCFRKIQTRTKEESWFSIYNIQKETWTRAKRLPVELDKDVIVTSYQEHIYFVSRSVAEGNVMLIQKFSPAYNAIVDSGYLKQFLYGPGAIVVKTKLYVLGGTTNADLTNPSLSVFSYEISTRRSNEVAALLDACVEPVVENIDNSLFAVGRNKQYGSVLQQYHMIPNQWTKICVIPELVTRGVIWGSKLYFILAMPTSFEVYDSTRDLWFTEELKNGPGNVTGVWYLEKTKREEARLLFREDDFTLRCYNLAAAKWDSCRDSAWNDDQCLSVHDIML